MKSDETRHNIKLGIFVFVGIAFFLITVFFIGNENNLFSKTFTAYAAFSNVEGLKQGDNVWLSGVKIGTVREVRIVSNKEVVVKLALSNEQNQFIKTNATASVSTDGFVGNKIVVIRPGDSGKNIEVNDTIGSFAPTDTQQLINIAEEVGDNTRALTNELKSLAQRINQGRGVVGELLQDGEIAKDLRAAVEGMRSTTVQTSRASTELASLMQKFNDGDGLINRLATDTTLVDVFNETLANVKEVGENSAEMSRNLEELVAKVNSDNSALGLLLSDTAFASTLKITLENAQSAAVKLDENMEALQHNFLLRGYFKKQRKKSNQ